MDGQEQGIEFAISAIAVIAEILKNSNWIEMGADDINRYRPLLVEALSLLPDRWLVELGNIPNMGREALVELLNRLRILVQRQGGR